VIRETGVCVWRSGSRPVLEFKRSGDFLASRMAILWTAGQHDTPGVVDYPRDYDRIAESGRIAREAVLAEDLTLLAKGIAVYHDTQLAEGMAPLPELRGALARKYCGGGYGGYAVYLFPDEATRAAALADTRDLLAVEPFCRL
jgi:hypothetical protein